MVSTLPRLVVLRSLRKARSLLRSLGFWQVITSLTPWAWYVGAIKLVAAKSVSQRRWMPNLSLNRDAPRHSLSVAGVRNPFHMTIAIGAGLVSSRNAAQRVAVQRFGHNLRFSIVLFGILGLVALVS